MSQSLSIALISDVHLEYNVDLDFGLPEADVLVCAGDLGSPFTKMYVHFLTEMVNNYEYVIVIPGNHEYYQHSEALNYNYPLLMKEVEQKIQEICNSIGAIFLQKSTVEIRGIVFHGCTLWSDPSSSGGEDWWPERYDAKHINDFKTVNSYLSIHKEHKSWLKSQLQKKTKKKVVVVTHHLPSYRLIETRFKGSSKNGYYTSNSDKLVKLADLWLAGHTHCFIDKKVEGVRCICNPIGYPWEDSSYSENIKIEI